jgi:hypothetical protein
MPLHIAIIERRHIDGVPLRGQGLRLTQGCYSLPSWESSGRAGANLP